VSAEPLAHKLRPHDMAEFIGQEHLKTRLTAISQAERLPSLLFFGPPGCGKSTLAILLAKARGLPYLRVSAPETGLQPLRKQLAGKKILILDELHRFSKAQQDFFLPLLESGEITLLATTTENPSFSVTKQLLSRMHVLRLRPLSHLELRKVGEKGQAALQTDLSTESLDMLIHYSGGDARTLLNLLEFAAGLPPDKRVPEALKASLPEAVLRGDRDGDSHYELASALIKSIRGSDPDAAVYYLACLVESGEDPRFICRRLIISSSEDVGLADPMALSMAVSCAKAVEMIGMPEGFIPLAETAIYLSLAKKSNSAYSAYLAARQEILVSGTKAVPLYLRNASTKLQKEWGYGKGYKYPHAYPGAYVEQEYLPADVGNREYYHPKDQGAEPRLAAWWQQVKRKKE